MGFPLSIAKADIFFPFSSTNDFALYQVALGLGHKEDAAKYLGRSRNWRNHWNKDMAALGHSGFLGPRDEGGNFIDQDPLSCGGCYWGNHCEFLLDKFSLTVLTHSLQTTKVSHGNTPSTHTTTSPPSSTGAAAKTPSSTGSSSPSGPESSPATSNSTTPSLTRATSPASAPLTSTTLSVARTFPPCGAVLSQSRIIAQLRAACPATATREPWNLGCCGT